VPSRSRRFLTDLLTAAEYNLESPPKSPPCTLKNVLTFLDPFTHPYVPAGLPNRASHPEQSLWGPRLRVLVRVPVIRRLLARGVTRQTLGTKHGMGVPLTCPAGT
jgi:hypothetical protein